MTARYGDRTRSNSPVGSWGKDAGAALSEITFTASPSPAVSSSPVTIAGIEYIFVEVTANTDLAFAGTPATAKADVVIVGGGGGGATSVFPQDGGGGGAGAARQTEVVLGAGPYPIAIGAGGSFGTSGTNGTPTTAFSLTMPGGGGGGSAAGLPGGSGGGSGTGPPGPPFVRAGGTSTADGNQGGWSNTQTNGCGGGGGAGGWGLPGSRPNPVSGRGGDGLVTYLPGSRTVYAGGGGGGGRVSPSSGGEGGGGRGARFSQFSPIVPSTEGGINTGGGGGGGADPTPASAGGSGIVVIRYRKFQP